MKLQIVAGHVTAETLLDYFLGGGIKISAQVSSTSLLSHTQGYKCLIKDG